MRYEFNLYIRFQLISIFKWRVMAQVLPNPVAEQSQTTVWGRSHVEMAGLNPARDMDVCVEYVVQ